MSARIRMRRRVTSGNIKDPGLHQQRLADLETRREAFWAVLMVVVGVTAFLAVAIFV